MLRLHLKIENQHLDAGSVFENDTNPDLSAAIAAQFRFFKMRINALHAKQKRPSLSPHPRLDAL